MHQSYAIPTYVSAKEDAFAINNKFWFNVWPQNLIFSSWNLQEIAGGWQFFAVS